MIERFQKRKVYIMDNNVMNKKPNKLVVIGLVVVFFVAFVLLTLFSQGPEHIEDTNGAGNYSLQQITAQDIIDCDMGTKGTLRENTSNWNIAGLDISEGVEYSSDKFTGVYCLYTAHFFKGSDIAFQIYNFEVTGGNFAFFVVFDGEIIGEVKPNGELVSEFRYDNIEKSGDVSYIIAGESASFKFTSAEEDW